MTGTADTEAFEFNSIYRLETIVIPTNRPMVRKDLPDLVYMNEKVNLPRLLKIFVNITKMDNRYWWGPSRLKNLKRSPKHSYKANIHHNVLNAKFHAMEADIIANGVTISGDYRN